MTVVPPTRHKPAIGRTLHVVILLVTLAGVLALWLIPRPGGAPALLRVQPIATSDITIVDQADVTVAVLVKNLGAQQVTPTCQVDAESVDGAHHGATQFTLPGPLRPARSTRFTVTLVISGLGADAVTRANARCH